MHLTGFVPAIFQSEFSLFPVSLASQGSKAYAFERRAFGFMLIYLSLPHLSQLVNLLGIFS